MFDVFKVKPTSKTVADIMSTFTSTIEALRNRETELGDEIESNEIRINQLKLQNNQNKSEQNQATSIIKKLEDLLK